MSLGIRFPRVKGKIMHSYTDCSRRTFLGQTAAIAMLGFAASPGNAQPPLGLRKRKSITKLSPADLDAWRAGVKEMKRRSQVNPSDPTGWLFQANVHGTSTAGQFFNQCQHGHWWFLPWHRMYLYYFERILLSAIDASGVPRPADFGLPYWDYTPIPSDSSNAATRRTIPQSLRDRMYVPLGGGPSDTNPLFDATRSAARNQETNPAPLPASSVSTTAAFGLTNFINTTTAFNSGFGGRNRTTPSFSSNRAGMFEVTPHGSVHNGVGGNMSSFLTAARDPIFWTHHCNLDRLWDEWFAMAVTENPDHNGPWGTQQFSFHNEQGMPVTELIHRFLPYVQDHVIDYVYDDGSQQDVAPLLAVATLAAHPHEAHSEADADGHHHVTGGDTMHGKEVFSFPPEFALTAEASTVRINVPQPARNPLEAAAAAIDSVPESTAPEKELLLVLEGIHMDGPVDGYYEVYLNLPDGATPDFKGPNYLGNLVPFNLQPHQVPDPASVETIDTGVSYAFSMTNAVRKLHGENTWDESAIQITFVPQAMESAPNPASQRLTFRSFRVIEAPAVEDEE